MCGCLDVLANKMHISHSYCISGMALLLVYRWLYETLGYVYKTMVHIPRNMGNFRIRLHSENALFTQVRIH